MNKLQFLKGVNLGGWLVLERWMTPSLFEGLSAVDEYTFMQTSGSKEKIHKHHRDFIKTEDFDWLSKNGINAIRIPVGYWIFGNDKPFVCAIERLDWAVAEAAKRKMFVLIDLHGAPGSQNGRDHSGRIGHANWYKDIKYRRKTIDILVRLETRYRDQKHVLGLELINEPKFDLYNRKLRQFYREAYQEISKKARPGFYVVFSDAFTPRLMSGAIRNPDIDCPVIMDNHWYQFLLGLVSKVIQPKFYFWYLKKRRNMYQKLERQQPVIVGEWSIVMSANNGNIFTGRKNETSIETMAEHGRLQMNVFESSTSGWFYWSYKTESPGVWNFRSLIENGTIILNK